MNTKKTLKISLISFILGLLLFILGFNLGGADYLKETNIDKLPSLKNTKNKESSNKKGNEKISLENFENLDIDLDLAEFEIKQSENNDSFIIYSSNRKDIFDFKVSDKTLKIKEKYHNLSIGFNSNNDSFIQLNYAKDWLLNNSKNTKFNEKISLYVPKKEFNEIKIKAALGNINLTDIKSNNLDFEIDLADLNIKNSTFSTIKIENDAGNINIDSCEADYYKLNQDLGNIRISDSKVNKSLELKNDTGNIDAEIIFEDDKYYNVKTSKDIGEIFVDEKFENSNRLNKEEVLIDVETDLGSIELKAK